jgi:hypothetical protein
MYPVMLISPWLGTAANSGTPAARASVFAGIRHTYGHSE